MVLTEHCPACDGTSRLTWKSRVAPFIAGYVLEGKAPPCRLCRCEACGLHYFDRRFTAEEMHRLYDDYRGERYVAARRRVEPGYSNRMAAGDLSRRRAELDAFLRRHLGEEFPGAVLDFGGDDGALIPSLFTGERLVYDVTSKPLAPGIVRIADLAMLGERPPSCILLCHVLEHVAAPLDLLQTIGGVLRPGGVLYVEVPNEPVRPRGIPDGKTYRGLLAWSRGNRIASRLFAATSRAAARFGRWLPVLVDPPLHEHINLFTERSLGVLLERAGFRVLVHGEEIAVRRALCRRL
jgi:SAM-dependent methyltransferase